MVRPDPITSKLGKLAPGDFARFDARCAHVETRLVAAGTGHGVHCLYVGVPPATGAAVGVRHRLTEAGAFPADIAHSGHGSNSSSQVLGSGDTIWRRSAPPQSRTSRNSPG